MSLFLRSGYSRIPVIGENTDQILGIVYLKDVAAAVHNLGPGEEPPIVDALARDVRYVPESKPVSDLLRELQKESTHVAIVIDEYGGTAGLVTLEDLIEEIVGEIVDEYDTESAEAVELGDGSYRVSARMSIDDLGELFDHGPRRRRSGHRGRPAGQSPRPGSDRRELRRSPRHHRSGPTGWRAAATASATSLRQPCQRHRQTN